MKPSRWSLLALFFLAPASAHAGPAPPPTGSICIAPFDSRDYNGPAMDLQGPGVSGKYTFRVDRKRTPGLEATVGLLERGFIERVPTDRPVLVEVLLDGKPIEAFRLDLGKEPNGRYCTQLYTGYWHWVRAFDDDSPGCNCWGERKP